MARGAVEWGRGAKWFSYKRITVAVCCVNLVVAFFLLRSIFTSFSPSNDNALSAFNYTDDQIKRVEESIRIRQASEPVELAILVKKLKKEFGEQEKRWELSLPVKQKLTNEILLRLKGLKIDANATEQREIVEVWRVEKLDEIKRNIVVNSASNSSIPAQEAKMLKRALESDWLALLEDIGCWMPADVINTVVNDKPENAPDIEEEETIAGPPLPLECHAELHTDYDGTAVRWGLTHHKESAADCCQACLGQAKNAKAGEKKCNIWVYCPSESGCHSPDIYEHKHQECWLKQAEKPRLNFKAQYSESYRSSHPTAPLVVPWMSGVITA